MTACSRSRSQKRLRRDLAYCSSDSFFSSVMVGAGETFLPAFVLALGLSQVASGMIAALPFLAGSVLQLAAPAFIKRVGSFRRWAWWLAALQALCFAPLAIGAWQGSIPSWLVFVCVTAYWTFGLSSSPAWNTWVTSLVPLAMRTRYFAIRNRLGQAGLLFGLVASGLLLEASRANGRVLAAFAAVFALSGVFRLISCWCLSRQSERPKLTDEQKTVRVPELLRRMRHGRDGRLILFLAVFTVAVNVSSPFFNPFMLKQLGLSYLSYVGLIAASYLTKVLVFPSLGRWGKRVGPFRLIRTGALCTAFLPIFWMVSPDPNWMLFVHVISGLIWAIFELGVMLALFETIRDEERTGFLSIYNFINALAVVGGTLIGGEILGALGQGHTGYMVIFAFSAVARFVCALQLDRFVLQRSLQFQVAAFATWIPASARAQGRRWMGREDSDRRSAAG